MTGLPDSIADPLRVVVLGGGFGGLELTARLSEELGSGLDLVLVDRAEDFVFGFNKLDVLFGKRTEQQVRYRYADIVKPGVRFVRADVARIDPDRRHVQTSAGDFDADVLVIALGAETDPAATPGLTEGGHDFYRNEGAFAAREALAGFAGGDVVVAAAGAPFKCPPAPSETVLLMHDYLTERGLRERSSITLVLPFPTPVPPAPAASDALLDAFAERGIAYRGQRRVDRLDSARRVAVLDGGAELPYDLFLGIPVHRVPVVVQRSGLTVDGWIPVDPLTLRTRWSDVYAIGDVTSVGTPKAGVFAEGQAAVVAAGILADRRNGAAAPPYRGRGVCYIEFGTGRVAGVDVTFAAGKPSTGSLIDPSPELAEIKAEFSRSRVQRWFGSGGAASTGTPD